MFCIMIANNWEYEGNTVTDKNVCEIKQSMLYLIFLLSEFFYIVLVTFVDIVFAIFVYTLTAWKVSK